LVQLGDALQREPRAARDAARAGDISPDHLRLIDDTLRWIEDDAVGDRLRDQLLAEVTEEALRA
jgi:hypothetical protein